MIKDIKAVFADIKLVKVIKKTVLYFFFVIINIGYPHPTNSIIPIRIPTQEKVLCYYDKWGVPFIYAKNEYDAFFVQGYVTARDRFFQLDVTRRKYQGRLTEIGGYQYLDSDLEALRLDYKSIAVKIYSTLSKETIDILQAYSDGINYYLKTQLFPCIELIVGPKPEPWTPIDTIGVGLLTHWTMSEDFYATQDWQKARITLGNDRFLEIYNNDVFSITSQLKSSDNYYQNLLPKYKDYLDLIIKSSPILQKDRFWGSNCVVVSGKRTTTGKPFIFNDPHIDIYFPSIWYEVDINVNNKWHTHGVSIPGVPGIIIGSNQFYGWGVTLMGADQIDVYQFPTNPQNPNQYLFNDQWLDFSVEEHNLVINQIGNKTPQTHKITVKRTAFGPVFFENEQEKYVQVVRWIGFEPTYDFIAFINMIRGKNFTDFRNALSLVSSSLNFLYADKYGNIAYQAAGKIPLKSTDGRWVLWGPDPSQHWQGYIDFNDLPYCLNPSRGYIVSANNQVFDPKLSAAEFIIQGYRSNGYRALQLEQALESKNKISHKDLVHFFFNNKSELVYKWITELKKDLNNISGLNNQELEVKNLLDSWDGDFDVNRPEPTIAALFLHNIYDLTLKNKGIHYFSINALNTLIMNKKLDEWWWTPKDANLNINNYREEIVTKAFKKTVNELISKYGENPKNWLWGKLHYITLASPLPILDRFSPGRIPSPGGIDSVNQGMYSFDRRNLSFPQYFGTSLRVLIDLRAPDQLIYMNIPGGQNANIFHRNSRDQIELWKKGQLKNLVIN